jgi:hypothetical protein
VPSACSYGRRTDDRQGDRNADSFPQAQSVVRPKAHRPNSVIVQFSPTDELRKTEKVLFENLQAMESAT